MFGCVWLCLVSKQLAKLCFELVILYVLFLGGIVSHMLNIFDIIHDAHGRLSHMKVEKTLAIFCQCSTVPLMNCVNCSLRTVSSVQCTNTSLK